MSTGDRVPEENPDEEEMEFRRLRRDSPGAKGAAAIGVVDDIFDGPDALDQGQQTTTRRRRQPATETFARIPHDKALALYGRINGAAWVLLVELDRLILKGGGQNPAKLSSARLRKIRLSRRTRAQALRELEAAGVVQVVKNEKGLAPWVRHRWLPLQD